jgi:hypothetical protein
MEQWEQWFREKQIERTITALKKNRFEAFFVPDAKTAFEEVMKRIPDGVTVGVGGSVTLTQMGLQEALSKRKVQLVWPQQQAKNVDATGNRVGATFIGPKKTIVVCGVNKIVKDLEAAEKRMKEWVAPQNAKRLKRKTPCVETGVCEDCGSPDRICNIYVTLAKRPARTEVIVILVGKNLGI